MKKLLLLMIALVANVSFAQLQNKDVVSYAATSSTMSRLEELVKIVEQKYAEGISYVPVGVEPNGEFSDHGYVVMGYDEMTAEAYINMTSNAPELSEGFIAALGDGNYDTYFHSSWSDFSNSPTPHNLVLDLGEGNELSAIAVKTMKRNTTEYNANRAPTEWVVYGSNDEGEDKVWTREGTLFLDYAYSYTIVYDWGDGFIYEYEEPEVVGFGCTGFSDAYRYLRFDAVNNLNNEANYFFALSEFGVWGAEVDESGSYNNTVPENVKRDLVRELNNARRELVDGEVTKSQLIALQAAYDAYLNIENEPQEAPVNAIFVNDKVVGEVSQFVLPVMMNAASDVAAFQFDLYLPKGLRVATDDAAGSADYAVALTSSIADTHVLLCSPVSDGAMRFVCYSDNNSMIPAGEAVVANITLEVDGELEEGTYSLALQNIALSVEDKVEIRNSGRVTKVEKKLLQGDVNGDGEVNIVDVSAIVSITLGYEGVGYNLEVADVNEDGKINVVDVSYLIKILIQ